MRKVVYFIIIVLFFIKSFAQEEQTFKDVPPDHWAYDAIEELAKKGYLDGYPDGTFRGRNWVNRYDLALLAAKIVSKLEELETAGGLISPEDVKKIKFLINNFQNELKQMNINVKKLQETINRMDERIKQTEKLQFSGEYKVKTKFVFDKYSTKQTSWADSEDSNDFNGINYVKHSASIYQDFKPNDKTSIHIGYDVKMDDWDNMTFSVTEGHLLLNASKFKTRLFVSEGYDRSSDLLKSWSVYKNYLTGARFSDAWGGFTFRSNLRNDLSVISNVLKWQDAYAKDGFWVTLKYKPKLNSKKLRTDFSWHFAEVVYDYNIAGKFSAFFGPQFNLSYFIDRYRKFNLSMQYGRTVNDREALGSKISLPVDTLSSNGLIAKMNYSERNFYLNVNYRNFGKWFFIPMGRWIYNYPSWKARRYGANYGRSDPLGERLFEMQMKYDIPIQPRQKITLNAYMMRKSWAENPDNPYINTKTEGQAAYEYNFKIIGNLSDGLNTNIEYGVVKDALPDEDGEYTLKLSVDNSFSDKFFGNMSLSYYIDKDNLNKFNEAYRERSVSFYLKNSISSKMWHSLSYSREYDAVGWDEFNSDSSVETLSDSLEYKIFREIFSNLKMNLTYGIDLDKDVKGNKEKKKKFQASFDYYISKLAQLNFKYAHVSGDDNGARLDSIVNWFAQLTVSPTPSSQILLRYGDKVSISDIARNNLDTEKKLYLEVKSRF